MVRHSRGASNMDVGWTLELSIALTAFSAALTGAMLLAALDRRNATRRQGAAFGPGSTETIFLFDGDTMVDASARARALLRASSFRGSSWQRLMAILAPRFPDLQHKIARLPTTGRIILESGSGGTTPSMTLTAEWQGGLSRISISDPDARRAIPVVDPLLQRTMEEELRLLRGTVAHAPMPIWLESNDGEIVWGNAAYLSLVNLSLGEDQELVWPLPRVMEVPGDGQQRVALQSAGQPIAWYEATVRPASHGRMIFAQPVDALVQAERSLRNFTQTLTKTFAQLPIGLTIFDQDRRMAIFNPALVDLTGLPVEFLSARPTLFDFLDQLRERQIIPEPRDYPTWRKRIVDLERDAAAGQFEETWNLASDRIMRVLGQPHPDGAMALLFQDISNETVRTERYRSDVELGQSVLNAIDEAVAVLSPAGALVLTNSVYAALWGHDPTVSLAGEARIGKLIDYWRSRTAPTEVWDRAEDFVSTLGHRDNWEAEVRLDDGRLLNCRFASLRNGNSLIACRAVGAGARRESGFVSSRSRQTA